jgi:hypothetical protein
VNACPNEPVQAGVNGRKGECTGAAVSLPDGQAGEPPEEFNRMDYLEFVPKSSLRHLNIFL